MVISGPVGAGKSTLAARIAQLHEALHIRTHDLMEEHALAYGDGLAAERRAFQEYGDRLDQQTQGGWVAEGVARSLDEATRSVSPSELVIIDAVREHRQVERLREAFGARVTHVHLKAPHGVLAKRYLDRGNSSGMVELASYDEVASNRTEAAVSDLEADADLVIDTDRNSVRDVATRVAAGLGLYASRDDRLVDVLIGAQYGSEGKGNIAFYLAPEYDVLMRVGGPNAGHKVPLPTPYTHRLLPSGTQSNMDAAIVIGPGATLDGDLLLKEIAECSVDVDRLFIDPQAMIIEQEDLDTEQRLVTGIGSTGKGGGAAAARRILGRNADGVSTPVRLARDTPELRPYLKPSFDVLDRAFARGQRVLLEGTQGTALSIFHGHYPHVTSRDTTTAGTLAEAGIGSHRLRRTVIVARTYPIRVKNPEGATSGPMSQEISWQDIAVRSQVPLDELLRQEKGSVSHNQRRVAEFDWDLLRRAAELNGATDVALTFTDYLDVRNREARRYEQLTPSTIEFVEEVERVAGVPASLLGTRFDVRSVIDRRRW
ncbi:adenylosuccinate synthetase [Amycolatopsis sp. WAC 01376]|uniref:adenylosuccinate synthetase n=1 Tax=Amycolatopsis sp. WAC 01376 TaxID=2203195 RepID=UPI0018F53EF3|nr:adenylosuccinate synthetase [Amycolatopsis sp. WAC 01376]